MSENLKNKMYNYEVIPPQGVWESIDRLLAEENATSEKPAAVIFPKRSGKLKFIAMAAAAVVILIVFIIIFRTTSKITTTTAGIYTDSDGNYANSLPDGNKTLLKYKRADAILKVPFESDSSSSSEDASLLANNDAPPTAGPTENTVNDNARVDKNKASDSKKQDHGLNKVKTYITITGPEGQPVKISSKIASLLVKSDQKDTVNVKWNKKLLEWKNTMQSNTLAATPGNFLDIVELTNTLTEN